MGKKKAARRDFGASDLELLRKRLRKAEDRLLDASAKRDRAQSRVEALVIIADEIRAQLAEAERAATPASAES